MIADYSKDFDVSLMCRLLGVSSSGYYAWCKRPASKRSTDNARLSAKIGILFALHKQRYGSPRITRALKSEGEFVGRHRVARLMCEHGLRAKAAKRFKATTNSNHSLPVAANQLKRDFSANKPNQKWVSDMTYIWTQEGWLYLACVMDCYSRKLIGWSLSERMTTSLTTDAMRMALLHRQAPKAVIVHSDRGSQYCANSYQQLLKIHQLRFSMSRKRDCYDNALMENWNHSFKVEAIHGERFKTREQAKQHIFDYIEVYYNRKRIHSALGYQTPEQFEQSYLS